MVTMEEIHAQNVALTEKVEATPGTVDSAIVLTNGLNGRFLQAANELAAARTANDWVAVDAVIAFMNTTSQEITKHTVAFAQAIPSNTPIPVPMKMVPDQFVSPPDLLPTIVPEATIPDPIDVKGTVAPEALKMSSKGAWDLKTPYAVNDTVTFGGSSYVAIAASTGSSPPDTKFWLPTVLPGSKPLPAAWDSTKAYKAGDVVSYQSIVYTAVQASTGASPPISPTMWNLPNVTQPVAAAINAGTVKPK